MRNFLLVTLITSLMVMVSGCSKPPKSPDFLFGSKLYNKFVDYYLKGEPRLAEMAFAQSENQFLKMDAMCNLSRIYIGRYVLDEEGDEENILIKAGEYGKLGDCSSELEAIKYLSGEKYDKTLLPKPYEEISGADSEKLVSISEDKEMSGFTRTRLLRTAAEGYLLSDPAKAAELAERALTIDRFNGWSLNILRDLIIVKSSLEKQNKEIVEVNKRIELIKAALDKK